ncbi:MAG: hypothetical protein OEQ13_00345 [Acidobacteriota bacterium]|nr:hypothetical protein [Acidobacteriota bacterium]
MRERLFIVVALATALLACREQDPLSLLESSRAAHTLELRTWVQSAAEPAVAQSNETDEGVIEVAGTAETLDEAAIAPAKPAEAHLSLLVADRGSRLELPCLTIDVVLEAGEGETSRVVETLVREIDISGLAEAGGGLDIVLRVPLPDESVTGIGVALHEVAPQDLTRLCEARAIARAAE